MLHLFCFYAFICFISFCRISRNAAASPPSICTWWNCSDMGRVVRSHQRRYLQYRVGLFLQSCYYYYYLSFHTLFGIVLCQFGKGATLCFFVQLCYLAAYGGFSVGSQHFGQLLQGLYQSERRLVKHHGVFAICQRV